MGPFLLAYYLNHLAHPAPSLASPPVQRSLSIVCSGAAAAPLAESVRVAQIVCAPAVPQKKVPSVLLRHLHFPGGH